jgi:hypothetical protein
VRPLLRNPRLLQTCGFTFAFFLPSEVRGLLNGENDRWIEHLPAHTIAHAADDLKAILDLRLRASSREGPTNDDGYVSSFAQLCVPDGTKESDEARRLERRLLDAAAGSPRRLLRLASRVIRQHCASASSAADPISWASIEAAIAAEALGRAGPAPAPTPPPALTPAPPPPAPTPTGAGLLAFYEDGQVTIGGQPVTRLNRLLYRVMALLWEHRGGIIPYDQFEGVLYGADMDLRGDPKSSREKLIRRLRSRIEAHNPNATASRTYIDVIDGVGYALRNYAPADR